ncbi:putative beta-lysine N-acetyltransferase [Mangrovibacterium lignilyticum]|uniref:putative beta-lysine N-acetyltransferase n=1 Tax=Mangrovibacterium lignilyticum TaxID=2668052 RepID=UPI001EE570D4|nr:putative beta-lysine N-acetyltransferase [Mangrovibacterium lignilyticum]
MIGIVGERCSMDKVEKLGQSLIHHGSENNRVYLLKLHSDDVPVITKQLEALALQNGYTKIIGKVPMGSLAVFEAAGYRQEAHIPGFFESGDAVAFMAKYFDQFRSVVDQDEKASFDVWLGEGIRKNDYSFKKTFNIARITMADCGKMANLYQQVFKSYPFPIFDPEYLKETIQEGQVIYFGVWAGAELVGLSSAELDRGNRNAEMTDFAVLPSYRGHKLALYLLQEMEKEMTAEGFRVLYTICRLKSPGMNKTFINSGYRFGGVLVNNTQIAGQIESMNVFYKNIEVWPEFNI